MEKLIELKDEVFTFSTKINSEEVLWNPSEELYALHLLSTSGLLRIVFHASFDVLQRYLPPGVTSVISWAEVEHFSPSVYGGIINGKIHIEKVSQHYVQFYCEVFDHEELIAKVRFRRHLVSVEYLRRRAHEKATEY